VPTPALLREAFLWSQQRVTATVSLRGNQYEVDAALVGRNVELVSDPFDLTRIEVRYPHGQLGTRTAGDRPPHPPAGRARALTAASPDRDRLPQVACC